ncbi:hypothetical protein [Allorhodopirellula solitaria]|uniref:Uncharacterized protein n=1 Tax=Allorhodopirellula solitaria TaxID=2527987 RepID=A0A5C5YC03_9BACT|nr:hypothetical protein [Allorhodopirellula solitaria]TWT73236.1 hypothetical protein CA85_17040 [Allorhodopirellula solitaria]
MTQTTCNRVRFAPFALAPSSGLLTLVMASTLSIFGSSIAAAQNPVISFDLPPTAVAVPISRPRPGDLRTSHQGEPVEITLRLSSLVSGAEMPRIDRWMVRCVPRDRSWGVINYSPRTETASEYASPIQVKTSDEQTQSFGVAADVTQGNLARGHAGMDAGTKQSEAMQYDRVAPLHAVTAAGTIERGCGVYYKLRWTSTQVLEGEKEFKVTFDVPAEFRSGLVDVSVVAMGRPAKQGSMTDMISRIPVLGEDVGGIRALGQARFVVAVHAEGDPVAWQAAREMTDTESALRREAARVRAQSPSRSLSTMIRHVAAKLDVDSVDLHSDWPDRLVFHNADPYNDPVIKKLPAELRVLVLDYCDARRSVETLRTRTVDPDAAPFQLNELVQSSIAGSPQ